jgi:hypothetical protein
MVQTLSIPCSRNVTPDNEPQHEKPGARQGHRIHEPRPTVTVNVRGEHHVLPPGRMPRHQGMRRGRERGYSEIVSPAGVSGSPT